MRPAPYRISVRRLFGRSCATPTVDADLVVWEYIRAETNAYAANSGVHVADARVSRHSLGTDTRRSRAEHRTDRSTRSRADCRAADGRHPRRARTVSAVVQRRLSERIHRRARRRGRCCEAWMDRPSIPGDPAWHI